MIETGPNAVDDMTTGASEDAVVVGGVVESLSPGSICLGGGVQTEGDEAEGSVFPGCSCLGESGEGGEDPVVVCARVAMVEISGGWL